MNVLRNLRFLRFSRNFPITTCSEKPTQAYHGGRVTVIRSIFSSERLGIENFLRMREEFESKLGMSREPFIAKICQQMEQRVPVVYTADLKAVTHLAQSDNDIEILKRMLKVYSSNLPNRMFGQFNFGPIVMRLLYTRNDPETAYALFTSKDLDHLGFFDQLSSRIILMQLLYDAERYDEVYSVMDSTIEKQFFGIPYPPDCMVIAIAACLKQNTATSYQRMQTYINGATEWKNTISHRCVLHATMLALKQGHLVEAGRILELMPPPGTRSSRVQGKDNVTLLYNARAGKVDEIFSLLSEIVHHDTPAYNVKGFEIFSHVFEECVSAIAATNNKEKIHEMNQLAARLKDGNHLVDVDLEEFLFRKIISTERFVNHHKYKTNVYGKKQQFSKKRNIGYVDVSQY